MGTTEFDEIRPYNDEELPEIYEELIADPYFLKISASTFPEMSLGDLLARIRSCKTVREFQKVFGQSLMWKIADAFSDGLSIDVSAIEDKTKAYTYISNHRDIILDSGFLSTLLVDNGMDTVEIAIGDNLLIYPWIKKLVRINKSFIVQRGLSMRQMLEASSLMSRYMHHTIKDKNQSIWIAQREGRAKDADDRTQESVLKMLAMGGTGDVIDRLLELNIAPIALSYEYDPCDFLKAQEFQLKRDILGYKKTSNDDLINMKTGLFGYKGKVHFQLTKPINDELLKLDRSLPKADLFSAVAKIIDNHIHKNYRIYPGNYIALDILNDSNTFSIHYTNEEKEHFEKYIAGQLAKIELPEKDTPFLYEKLLLMYANPLKNFLAAK